MSTVGTDAEEEVFGLAENDHAAVLFAGRDLFGDIVHLNLIS